MGPNAYTESRLRVHIRLERLGVTRRVGWRMRKDLFVGYKCKRLKGIEVLTTVFKEICVNLGLGS